MQPLKYSRKMYIHALGNSSTAPDYVLITVVMGNSKEKRILCTEAPFLEGAIHTEYEIPYDQTGKSKIRSISQGLYGNVLNLKKLDAIKNVRPRYSEKELRLARSFVGGKPESLLLNYTFLQKFYVSQKGWQAYAAHRDALAHVLLEQGISCRRGCIGGDLSSYKIRE